MKGKTLAVRWRGSRPSGRLASVSRRGTTQLWIAPGTEHVGARRTDPVTYDARVIEFFLNALAGEP